MGIFHLYVKAIEKTNDRFAVSTPEPGENEETVTFTRTQRFDENVQKLRNREEGIEPPAQYHETLCSSIGETLFVGFVAGRVYSAYKKYCTADQTPRIALHLPRHLYGLPWELLRDPEMPRGQFIARYGSVIRYDADSPADLTTIYPLQTPPTYLYVLSSPADLPKTGNYRPGDVPHNRYAIREVSPPTYEKFQRALRAPPPDGFAFFGHGDVKDGRGVLMFEQSTSMMRAADADPIGGDVLADEIGPRHNVKIIFLCACESAWSKSNVPFENTVAGALLDRTYTPFVIGAQNEINSAAAITLLGSCWEEVSRGVYLDLALSAGRRNIYGLKPPARFDWWIPVFYAKTLLLRYGPGSEGDVRLPNIAPEGTPSAVPASTAQEEAGIGLTFASAWRQLRQVFQTNNHLDFLQR